MAARKKIKLVHGVGVNDADHPITRYEIVDGKSKRVWVCPFYRKWESMLNRCYSRSYLDGKPTYEPCAVAAEWHSFTTFSLWMRQQQWQEMSLDKDILSPGNKLYSPEFCIFVTPALNSFLTDSGAVRGEHPIGVFFNPRHGKFESHCNNPFTGKYDLLGNFSSPALAHEAWRMKKHEHACRYGDLQDDERISVALRARYLPSEGFSYAAS